MTNAACTAPAKAVGPSLDPPETSGISHSSYAAWRRKSLPAGEWEATIDTLAEFETPPDEESTIISMFATRLERLLACRTRATFVRHVTDGSVKVMANTCKDRWCPVCAKARALRIAGQCRDWLESIDHPKLLTLTIASSDETLGQQIDRMVLSFNRLRKEEPFKTAWRGGIWFFQVTFNTSTEKWHPHIHALIDGNFIRQKTIATAWDRLTGGSRVVDIRTIKDAKAACCYVSRYVSRPSDLEPLPPDRRIEIVQQLKGRRLVNTFGTAHKAGLLKKEPIDRSVWKRIGSWSTITALYSCNATARMIWHAWRAKTALPEWATLADVDDQIGGIVLPSPPPPRTIQLELAI